VKTQEGQKKSKQLDTYKEYFLRKRKFIESIATLQGLQVVSTITKYEPLYLFSAILGKFAAIELSYCILFQKCFLTLCCNNMYSESPIDDDNNLVWILSYTF